MNLEKIIIDKYRRYGVLSANDELLLPLNTWRNFLDDCNQLFIAVIGVDFFIPLEKERFIAGMNSLDVSIFLETHQNWEEVVRLCNTEVGIVLQKEIIRDTRQYYCPVFCERNEWEQKYKPC